MLFTADGRAPPRPRDAAPVDAALPPFAEALLLLLPPPEALCAPPAAPSAPPPLLLFPFTAATRWAGGSSATASVDDGDDAAVNEAGATEGDDVSTGASTTPASCNGETARKSCHAAAALNFRPPVPAASSEVGAPSFFFAKVDAEEER